MFNENDLKLYKMLKVIIGDSSVNMKGNAVLMTALAFKWFEDLEKRIEENQEEK